MAKKREAKKPSVDSLAREACEAFKAMGEHTSPSGKSEVRKKFNRAMLRLGERLDG